jgi:TolA-binding protein
MGGERILRTLASSLILCLVATATLMAQNTGTTTTTQSTEKTQTAKKAKNKTLDLEQQIKQLREDQLQRQQEMQQQQNLVNQLQNQLQQLQQQVQSGVQQASQQAQAAQQAAASAEQATNTLTSSVTELKTSTGSFSQSLAATQKDVKDLLNPLALHYKGVTITPGGFIVGAFIWRSRNENATSASSYGASPFGGTVNAHLSEYQATTQSSRPWKVRPVILSSRAWSKSTFPALP